MKSTLGLVLFTAILSVAASPFQEPPGGGLKLQRPKFKKGDIIISKTLIEVVDAKLSSPNIPKKDEIRISFRLRDTKLTEITATDDGGAISEIEENILVSMIETKMTGKIEGKEINRGENNSLPLDDSTIRYSQKKGVWVGRLTEGETTKEFEDLLDGYLAPDEESFLPEKPVGLGQSWTLKGAKLRKYAPGALKFNGSGEFSFEKVVKLNGRDHALVKGVCELDFTTLDENQNELRNRTITNINIWIDIQTGLETEAKGKGTIITEGAFGEIKDTKLTGPQVINVSRQLLRRP